MLTYFIIILFIIVLFLDVHYKKSHPLFGTPSIASSLRENLHGGGQENLHGGGQAISSRSAGPVLAGSGESNLGTAEAVPSSLVAHKKQRGFHNDPLEEEVNQIQGENKEIFDVIRAVYQPPAHNNIEGGIREKYTEYSPKMSDTSLNSSPPNASITNMKKLYGGSFQGNPSKIGKLPPDPIASTCYLDFDCVGYPYDSVDDRNGNVCKKCIPNDKLNYGNESPTYVMAREAGRVRQVRNVF